MADERLTLPGPNQGERLALEDVQSALGGFIQVALKFIPGESTEDVGRELFPKLDYFPDGARPAHDDEHVLSSEETREIVNGWLRGAMKDSGFSNES